MAGMTERELACFVRLLEAEEMEEAARSHARRLEALCALCGGGR